MNTTNQKVSRRDVESAEKSLEKRTLSRIRNDPPGCGCGVARGGGMKYKD